ncbi:MAG TPA: pyridoxamine 5'-phosphate oxidase [Polyangiaceae bacterium]|nr:pyridoxamine 5'-phosphate oxidase [Polyangiaceae bacterium]
MSSEFSLGPEPLKVFLGWFDEAVAAADPFPDAMTLATCTASGRPSARVVLYKGLSDGSLRFFTNYSSRKGRELEENPFVAALFHWTSLARQVRIEGRVEALSAAESDAYFRSRERQSQLGAWASPQSQTIAERGALTREYAAVEVRYAGAEIPRPAHWGGYRIIASSYEFWIGREHRLHDRVLYTKAGAGYRQTALAP